MRDQEGLRDREELRRVIRTVRNRWRARKLLKGGLVTLAAGVAAVIVVSVFLSRGATDPLSATFIAVLVYLLVGWTAIRYLFLPGIRRLSDRQVALYLEEHEPELQAEILTAVEAMEELSENSGGSLLDGLVRAAVSRSREVEGGRRIDREPLQRLSWTTAGAVALVLLTFLVDPLGVRTNLPDTFQPWSAVEAASPMLVQVTPGDTVLVRGSELQLTAWGSGFEPEAAIVALRTEDGDRWERWPMIPDSVDLTHEFTLFRVDEPIEYFVEANGVRSPTHRVQLTDLPYVSRLELEIHHPAYTGRAPERIENGRDLAVLPGTRVTVRAHPTVDVPGGRIVLEGAGEVELATNEAGVLEGEFRVERSGSYRVELSDDHGVLHRGTPDHLIDLLEDLSPVVSLHRPGHDVRVTSIEEVYVEARAADDHAVATLELIYSVNGEEPRTVSLIEEPSTRLREVSAGHTFFLEEHELRPGDLIAYHARALDNGPNPVAREARTDLFFIEIRPFSQDFRQADAGGQMSGDGGQDGDDLAGQFSQRQRDIVTATFNVERDRRFYAPGQMEEDLTTLTEAQRRLQDEVGGFLAELIPRLGRAPEEMHEVADLLPRAMEAMGDAVEKLREGDPSEALPPEQRALQYLLRAESVFREVQLTQSDDGSGGGGGDELREDLADYFDLEMDRLRNQYEELQRGERREFDEQRDETLERLRELARRQEQERERLRRAQEHLPAGSPAPGGESQRRLAEETEEAARQLERLAREQSSPEMAETARRLQEAAEAMRRSAAMRDQGGTEHANEAARALEEARRLLDRDRRSRLEREASEAAERARRAAEQQRAIEDAVDRLPDGPPAERRTVSAPLDFEREDLLDELQSLRDELRRLAGEAAQEDREAERAFREAASAIGEGRIMERVEFARRMMDRMDPEQAREHEAEVTRHIEELAERVQAAAGRIESGAGGSPADLAERARELARGAESMEERSRRASEGRAEGEAMDSEAARQLSREAGERAGEAEALRSEVEEMGGPTGALDGLIGRFRELEAERRNLNPREAAVIHRELVEGLLEFEFELRRHFAGGVEGAPMAANPGEVPESYRELVEEYFRNLAEP